MNNKRKLLVYLLAFAALSFFPMSSIEYTDAAEQTSGQNISKADSRLIQFRAGRYILGFAPDKAYLAGIDHTLTVEFMGTRGVAPKSDKPGGAAGRDQAPPLGEVTYENLWPGVSLTYKTAKNGITESIYHISPKTDVSKIRLKYNVPVEILKNGSLRFIFNNGHMTESAPVAWQDIKGKRKFVKVRFKLANGELGFKTGKYNPKYALTIDPFYEWHESS